MPSRELENFENRLPGVCDLPFGLKILRVGVGDIGLEIPGILVC
jgi:hypothetical protein